MILRDLDSLRFEQAQISRVPAIPIWQAIEGNQTRLVGAESCWLITQPAHSALSGDIAAKLDPAAFGKFDDATIRAIALHDAGWSNYDSELIRASRSEGKKKAKMVPFLAVAPEETVAAWTGSIETALKASGVGAFLVSEHFRTIAQHQAKARPETGKQMARFIAQEDARQAKLRPKLSQSDAELQRMVEGLRFCDLLSLYICTGISDTVELPQKLQSHSILLGRVDEQTLRISPSPFAGEEMFSFAALRHPRTKLVSSASFAVRIMA